MKKWILSPLNFQTFALLLTAAISCFVSIRYQIKIHHNIMLFGLIISFPLVFSLQSAFKRRERALEYLSMFSSSLISVSEAFQQSSKITDHSKREVQELLLNLQSRFIHFLKSGEGESTSVLQSFNQVSVFMTRGRKEINSKIMFRIGRYMKDVYESATFLVGIKTHRTSVGIRILSYLFIGIFPVIQAQFLLNTFSNNLPDWSIYIISFVTSLTLSALLLIQKQLEDPFDQDGLDDLRFEKLLIIEEFNESTA